MNEQTKRFNKRYGSQAQIDKMEAEELEQLRQVVEECFLTLPKAKQHTIDQVVRQLRIKIKNGEYTPKENYSNGVIGHLLTELPNCKWVNCGCGGLGKFMRR